MALVKAAMRTFERVYTASVSYRTPTSYITYTLSNIFGNLSQTDCSVGTNARLLIIGSTSQKLQQLSINDTVTQFVNDC